MDDSTNKNEFDHAWKPVILSPRDQVDKNVVTKLKDTGKVMFFDTFELQLTELIKTMNPKRSLSLEELSEKKIDYYKASGNSAQECGNWIYYPWRKTLVRVLEEKDFIRLRTIRNKYKITEEEQQKLREQAIGVIGLSVGQSVALCLAMERCFGELRIADFDTLDLSNMNRIRTGLFNLGLKKSWIVAREIAEIDPYLKVSLFNDGVSEANLEEFLTWKGKKLDLLIEECDSLPVKIQSRIKAKRLGIPVIMDTSDRGMMDIERFDQEPGRPIFHGLLGGFGEEADLMAKIPDRGKEIMMALLQFDNLSERVKYSFLELGKSITSWPQLASSVVLGGAACCHYARMILLGLSVASGRFYVDLDQIIDLNEG
ncbi:ThiF family adenylyltransferase [Cyclobacterium jeungdonense]|uniref:ThiF family adenylyltransferase n=1 Tax=Cyclobacterium jeungdonense TaxID=708087 RepID=A0ABT8C549_9BACT|nr:ThiF family adenylyltransferase [Cyclobacterium jeungdonense]MDN3686743.1 ThiF family adenylyltransferase [Cyclobacterium jeungdonense]